MLHHLAKMSSQNKNPNKIDTKKDASEIIVFPDEEKDVKATIAEAAVEIKSNTIEEKPIFIPKIENRNVITVPPNCPPGQKPDENGICRDVF